MFHSAVYCPVVIDVLLFDINQSNWVTAFKAVERY